MTAFAFMCPKCKTPNPRGVIYCVKCGHWLLDSRFSGIPLSRNEYHRLIRKGYSGEQINHHERSQWVQPAVSSGNRIQKKGRLGWGIGILLLCWFIFGVYQNYLESPPQVSSTQTAVEGNNNGENDQYGNTISSDTPLSEIDTKIDVQVTEEKPDIIEKNETKEQYIASCSLVDFKEICRNPDRYAGQRVAVNGQILQYLSGSLMTEEAFSLCEDYQLDLEGGETFLERKWYVAYTQPSEDRILDKDIVTFYGEFDGMVSLETVLGAEIQVPRINGKYHLLLNSKE